MHSALQLPVLASSTGNLALGAFIVILLAGGIFAYYSRRGSDISQRPQGREKGGQPGVGQGNSRISSSDDHVEEAAERERGPR